MAIKTLTLSHVDKSLHLWNMLINQNELLYKPLVKDQFILKFLQSTETYEIKSFVDEHDDHIKGFSSGVIVTSKQKAYLTTVVVDPRFRRQKIASHLLNAFEDYVLSNYPSIESIDVIFFNPVQFEWIIPHTTHHDHPNAPGIDLKSTGYHFLNALGYSQFAKQNSYYKNIKGYTYNEDILSAIKHLKEHEITITFFDQQKHYGLDALFVDLNNPYWTDEITKATKLKKPVLIAEKNGLVIGFTGPLGVQKSLRGYFAGIGVHSGYRGYGAGKVLFSSLCLQLSKLGAHYMSLFTGESNSARRIYEKEGFKIVRSWANMRKELKK